MTLLWLPSPHHYRGRNGHTPDLLVQHYTAGRGNAQATARVFQMRSRQASAHFIEGRLGDEAQCVDCDDAAWHAGDSGKSRFPSSVQIDMAIADGSLFVPLAEVPHVPKLVNERSFGIEWCNRGWAPRGPNPYAEARHRNPACRSKLWESFSDVQIDAGLQRVKWLRGRYPSMRFMCGHEDVTNQETIEAVGGKTDPGPLFPWAPFQALGLIRVKYNYERHGWEIEA